MDDKICLLDASNLFEIFKFGFNNDTINYSINRLVTRIQFFKTQISNRRQLGEDLYPLRLITETPNVKYISIYLV